MAMARPLATPTSQKTTAVMPVSLQLHVGTLASPCSAARCAGSAKSLERGVHHSYLDRHCLRRVDAREAHHWNIRALIRCCDFDKTESLRPFKLVEGLSGALVFAEYIGVTISLTEFAAQELHSLRMQPVESLVRLGSTF